MVFRFFQKKQPDLPALPTGQTGGRQDSMMGQAGKKRGGVMREYGEALFSAVFLAFLIRSFIIEPYKIPSKSMVPTLLVGDHIFVNKFIYGLRIPMTKKWIFKLEGPKRGEVIIFIYPEDESLDFIKRAVGVQGDQILIEENQVYVNGELVDQRDIDISGVDRSNRRLLAIAEAQAVEIPKELTPIPFFKGYENYHIEIENLSGQKHLIQKSRLLPHQQRLSFTVPPDHYFVMGDNRDQSSDSRYWGFVPRENLKGRAMFIWLSLDSDLGGLRLNRFARKIL